MGLRGVEVVVVLLLVAFDDHQVARRQAGFLSASYRLTEVIYDLRSSPAKKHFKERKMNKHFIDMSGKPDSVIGDYSTQELDAGAVTALKKERSEWWGQGIEVAAVLQGGTGRRLAGSWRVGRIGGFRQKWKEWKAFLMGGHKRCFYWIIYHLFD